MADDIAEFVKNYIEVDSGILEEIVPQIEASLEQNMRDNLWVGHGYDTGELYDNIQARSEMESSNLAIITGFYTVEHGDYVISGVRGKGYAKSGPIDFLTDGVDKTVEMYK